MINLIIKMDLSKMLFYWDQAGERPYQLFKDMKIYDKFIQYLDISCYINENIYRGTRRHQELEINDILDYQYPTSWSLNQNIAENFIIGVETPVLLIYSSENAIKGLKNEYGMNDEEEFILYPSKLKIISKEKINEKIIFHLK